MYMAVFVQKDVKIREGVVFVQVLFVSGVVVVKQGYQGLFVQMMQGDVQKNVVLEIQVVQIFLNFFQVINILKVVKFVIFFYQYNLINLDEMYNFIFINLIDF